MQYKRVISFGDSFTFGSDLSDAVVGPYVEYGYSYKTWPALLAKYYELDYHSYAVGGSSNAGITRRLLDRLSAGSLLSSDLVIVNWTWIDRYEFYNRNTCNYETVRPTGTEDSVYHNFYFKHIYSDKWNRWESLKNITLVYHLLKEQNINFIFTCLDKLLIDDAFSPDQMHTSMLVTGLRDTIVWFESLGFYDWAVSCGFPLGDTGHPLEQAHQTAFEYLRDNYDFTK